MCMTSDPYAAGYTFARSAFTGGPTQDQKAVRTIYIYIYIIESIVIESVDFISRDERDVPLTQYITNA